MNLLAKLQHPRQTIRVGKHPVQRFKERINPAMTDSDEIREVIKSLLREHYVTANLANPPANYRIKVDYNGLYVWIICEVGLRPILADIRVITVPLV